MEKARIKKGDVVLAPWREFGDDANLTGIVVSVARGMARVVWNADGDVTSAGDESMVPLASVILAGGN